GEDREAMLSTLEHSTGMLPTERPRYFMGIGKPEDLIDAIARGVDMFDCVIGTRNGRNATLFSSEGVLHLRNRKFVKDERPVDPRCDCRVCRTFSRAYLRHLYKADEMLGPILGSLHNTHYLINLVRRAREGILNKTFPGSINS
ncbi:MAG: tRNA-guanine transglycosylase, partial [Planctomycetota bacterium]